MREMSKHYGTVEEYLADQPRETREKLKVLRKIIKAAAPQATETISYNIPAYDVHGKLVYFAGYKAHIGLYPTASGIKAFQNEIAAFGYSKGAIRFPLDQPLPQALITRIVKYRLKENLEKASFKTAKTTKPAKNSKPAKRKKP